MTSITSSIVIPTYPKSTEEQPVSNENDPGKSIVPNDVIDREESGRGADKIQGTIDKMAEMRDMKDSIDLW